MSDKMRKFLSYYKPYKLLFFADLFSALSVAGIALVFPLGVRAITQRLEMEGAQAAILWIGAGLLLLALIQFAFSYFMDAKGHMLGARIERDMRDELFTHLQTLSFSFYDSWRTGQLLSRLTNDLLALTELYHHGPEDLTIHFAKTLGTLIILFLLNAKLTLILLCFFPLIIAFTVAFNRRMKRALTRNKERIADVNAQAEDTLAGIRIVQSFGNEAHELHKFRTLNERFYKSRMAGYTSEAVCYGGLSVLVQLLTIATVVFGGIAITRQELQLADLLSFLLYVGYLTEPIWKIMHLTAQFQDGFTSFDRFWEVLQIPPEIRDAPGAQTLDAVRGDVEFRSVGFRYQENTTQVLRNIDLTLHSGESVALVGSSGVGKTTLCSLLPRFYDVSEGAVLLDGRDVRGLTLASLRANIGVVHQDVYLFAGTVRENIAYGKPGAREEEIIEAAKKANAHAFIEKLPQGYDTDIGQRGVRLSGGQRQRLSIARVFLKNPPVLLFDEATSSLDAESERVVQESLAALSENRTTLIIAHRLSTIRSAKRIAVLTEAGIEAQGTHAELMAEGGAYARLFATQFAV